MLDRGWAEEARRATRRFPPGLPGGRPAPAPLRGVPVILGLLAGGGVLCIGGLMSGTPPPRASRGLSRQKPE